MKSTCLAIAALLIASGCSSFHPIHADSIAEQSYYYGNPSKKMALYIIKEYLASSLNDPKWGRELRELELDETGFKASCIFNDPAVNNFGGTRTMRAHWDSLSELRVEESGSGSNRVVRVLAIFSAPDYFTMVSQSPPGQSPQYQADLICAIQVLSAKK
jgi:hypothetical protein